MIKWLYSYLLIIPFVVQVFGQGEILGIARWQFIHAIFFVGMLLIVANCFQKARTKNVFNWDHIWLVGSAVWLFILFHTFFLGDPLTDGIFFFIKFEFWMIFVLLFLTLSDTPRQVDLFVWLIILGGCFNAMAVIFYYFEGTSIGVKSVYTEIQSAAGNSDVSGKGTVGIMISAFWMVFYRYRGNIFGLIPCLMLGLLLSAVMLTYDRSGQLALGLGMVIMLFYGIKGEKKLLKIVLPLLIFGGLLLATVGVKNLFIRWTDTLYVHDSLGSGRDVLWKTAWLYFRNDIGGFLSGYGVEEMFRTSLRTTTMRIHMHSDFFDLMVLAGISGVFFWIYYMVNLWVAIRRAVLEVFDRVLAINILVCIFILSLMTGQMYFPTTMCYQLCSLFSILMLSDKDFFKKNEMQTEELCYANQLPRR